MSLVLYAAYGELGKWTINRCRDAQTKPALGGPG